MRLLAARLVWLSHVGLMLYLLVAWSFASSTALWAAVVVYPLVQLHWWSNGNRCALTVLEERLRRASGEPAPADDPDAPEPVDFVQGLLSRVLGRPVSRAWGDRLSQGVIWLGFAIAALRLYARGGGVA